MPRKTDSIPINDPRLDRRVKLLDSDKSEIAKLWKSGMSQRELARRFMVDRRTIDFIIHPERLERNKQLRLDRGGWRQYYNKEKNRQAIKEHRDYKKKIFKDKRNHDEH